MDYSVRFVVRCSEEQMLVPISHIMPYNTHYFESCLATLQLSIRITKDSKPDSTPYEVFQNAVIKGFELLLEMAGNLLRKALESYGGSPEAAVGPSFKDVLRHASKRDLLDTGAVARSLSYRDNRNFVAHGSREAFTAQALALRPGFISNSSHLAVALSKIFSQEADVDH